MLIGYARVSTDDQSLNLRKDALLEAGGERVFENHFSGAKSGCPGLSDTLGHARVGNALMVWRLDCLSRSLKDLIKAVIRLESLGIGLKSLQATIDTSSSTGRLVCYLFGDLPSSSATWSWKEPAQDCCLRVRGAPGRTAQGSESEQGEVGSETVRQKTAYSRPDLCDDAHLEADSLQVCWKYQKQMTNARKSSGLQGIWSQQGHGT